MISNDYVSVSVPLPPSVDIEVLYRELFTPLFRYVFFRTADYDVACDVTQNTFLKFIPQLETVSDRDHAQKLLFVIARHTLIDHWRKASVRLTATLDDWESTPDVYPTPEEEAVRADDTEYVRSMIAELAPLEAEVVSLRLSGDLTYEVIAETLGISVMNARKVYSRALHKIRQQVNESNCL